MFILKCSQLSVQWCYVSQITYLNLKKKTLLLKDSEYHLTLQVATKFEFLKKNKEVELLAKHKNVEVFTIHRTEIGLYVCRP